VLPQLTSATGLGATAVAAYAAREGVDAATYQESLGPALIPEQAGQEIAGLAAGSGHDERAYVLTSAGLRPAP
jgi:hypothetical protein